MRIKNWEKFQHYAHRRPPWIKLYRDLLDDPEWMQLSGDASKMLANCWLVACETEGELPNVQKLAWRLRMDVKKCMSLILELDHWIILDASTVLAQCEQGRASETETETETETEGEKIVRPRSASAGPSVKEVLQGVLDKGRAEALIEHRQRLRKPLTLYAARLLAKALSLWPDPNAAADAMIERGWVGFRAEWMHSTNGRGPPAPKRNAYGDVINKVLDRIEEQKNAKQPVAGYIADSRTED